MITETITPQTLPFPEDAEFNHEQSIRAILNGKYEQGIITEYAGKNGLLEDCYMVKFTNGETHKRAYWLIQKPE